jgi:hypothetical protein
MISKRSRGIRAALRLKPQPRNKNRCASPTGPGAEEATAAASSLSDLAQRAGLGRIGALIRPFFVAGWDAIGQFPHD